MRILQHGWKDFYDYMMMYGADKKATYDRHPNEFEPDKELGRIFPQISYSRSELSQFFVSVAGVIYGGVYFNARYKELHSKRTPPPHTVEYEELATSMNHYVHSLGINFPKVPSIHYTYNDELEQFLYDTGGRYPQWRKRDVMHFLGTYPRKQHSEIFLEKKIPILFGIQSTAYSNYQGWVLRKDIMLRDIKFWKMLSAETVFQELSMFISNMNNKEYSMKELGIPDKVMVVEKGFDNTYGFRKRPKQ